MNIKTKTRDPKNTDFAKNELVININEGSLFYKSNKGVHKINPSTGTVSTVIGSDGTPGEKGDQGDAGANAVSLSISSNTNIFTFDNSGDPSPTPSACTITVIQNNQNNNLLPGSLYLLTNNATISNPNINCTNGSGVATWTVTPAQDGEANYGIYPISVQVSSDNITKTLILHKVEGGDPGITLPGTPGDSYFNDQDGNTVATTATNNVSIDANVGIGYFGGLGAWTNPTEKLELNGNLLLNPTTTDGATATISSHIRSTGDIDLLTDDGATHAEDKCYIKIKGDTAATDINGDLNLVQNHSLTGTLTSGQQGNYNGYPQYITGTTTAYPEYWCTDGVGYPGTPIPGWLTTQTSAECTGAGYTWVYWGYGAIVVITGADDFSKGYFAAGGVGNFSCEGDTSVGKFLTVGWNTTGGSGVSTTATIPAMLPLGSIVAVGNVYSGATVLTSDIKLKKNITPIEDSLNKILSLEGKTYEWKDKTKPGKQYGLIAQDVEKTIPELVEQGETKYLNYTGIIPVLIEAIKDQQKQIDKLKSKIK